MHIFLFVLITIAVLATLYILVRGVIGMASGKDLTGQRSQELMRKRVLFQAIAIILIVILLLIARPGGH
jgi:hypothetical protein